MRKPGVYGIRPGDRLSSLLKRAGGMLPTAYPHAAVFERNEVRELQQKSRQELIQRLEQESTVVKTAASTTGTEEAALQQAAMQQRQRVLDALRKAPVSGRLVVHIRTDRKDFAGSPDDIELRAGDSLTIPKQPGAVLVIGQVYNSNALTYTPGRNAGWYLSHAGGPTKLADKGAIFIVRADGSVSTGRQGGFWSGSVLSTAMGPGDTIVVPERPVLGSNTLKNVLSLAQIASSAGSSSSILRGLCDQAPENATAVAPGADSSTAAPSGVEKSAADGSRGSELLRLTVTNPHQIGAGRCPAGRARCDEGIPRSAPLAAQR